MKQTTKQLIVLSFAVVLTICLEGTISASTTTRANVNAPVDFMKRSSISDTEKGSDFKWKFGKQYNRELFHIRQSRKGSIIENILPKKGMPYKKRISTLKRILPGSGKCR